MYYPGLYSSIGVSSFLSNWPTNVNDNFMEKEEFLSTYWPLYFLEENYIFYRFVEIRSKTIFYLGWKSKLNHNVKQMLQHVGRCHIPLVFLLNFLTRRRILRSIFPFNFNQRNDNPKTRTISWTPVNYFLQVRPWNHNLMLTYYLSKASWHIFVQSHRLSNNTT